MTKLVNHSRRNQVDHRCDGTWAQQKEEISANTPIELDRIRDEFFPMPNDRVIG